jgi:class 3 adenylate cyclase
LLLRGNGTEFRSFMTEIKTSEEHVISGSLRNKKRLLRPNSRKKLSFLTLFYDIGDVDPNKPGFSVRTSSWRLETWITSIAFWLFPLWQLNFSPWRTHWLAKNFKELLFSTRIALVLLAVGYPLHFYFVDIPLGLNSDERWFYYRFGLGALAAVSFALSFVGPFQTHFRLRLLFGFNAALVCYFQARSMLWYDKVPYFWGLLFVWLFATIFRLSMLPSMIIAGALLAAQLGSYVGAGVSPPLIMGAYLTVMMLVALFSARLKAEIAAFLTNQEFLLAQQKLVETQKEMSDQIQAFLPKIIKQRLIVNIQRRKMTVLQAMDEVLRVRHARIAALFSDIRGFTSNSKQANYLGESAIPNIKSVIQLTEEFSGIPRQIGDLVFAYFDESQIELNLRNSLLAASKIVEMNEVHNKGVPEHLKIRRFVLLDIGEALVGNIGGADSSREITAMGTCVNRLSRLDLLTKENALKNILGFTSVLLSEEAVKLAESVFPTLPIEKLDLSKLGLSIRDFPEEQQVGLVTADALEKFHFDFTQVNLHERKAS